MVDQPLSVDFLYCGGDPSDLFERHRTAMAARCDVRIASRVIDSPCFDSIHVTPYDVIDDKWDFEDLAAFEYDGPSGSVDLADCALVEYVTKSQDHLDRYRAEHDVSAEAAISELVGLVRIAYEAIEPTPDAVFSQTPDHAANPRDVGGPPVTAEALARDRLEYLPWLAVFTPPMVETYGRETLLSAPAWRVEELADGAILVVCHDDLDWEASVESVADHVGVDAYTSLF